MYNNVVSLLVNTAVLIVFMSNFISIHTLLHLNISSYYCRRYCLHTDHFTYEKKSIFILGVK